MKDNRSIGEQLRNPGIASSGWPDDLVPEDEVASGRHRDASGIIAFPLAIAKRSEFTRILWMRRVLEIENERFVLENYGKAAVVPVPEFKRVGGDVLCEQCGLKLYDHPVDPRAKPLRIRCNRERAKL